MGGTSWRLLTYMFPLHLFMGRTPPLITSILWHSMASRTPSWVNESPMARACQTVDKHDRMLLRQVTVSGSGNSFLHLVLQSNGEFSSARCQTPFEVSIKSFTFDFTFKVSLPFLSQEPGFPLTGSLAWEFWGCAMQSGAGTCSGF